MARVHAHGSTYVRGMKTLGDTSKGAEMRRVGDTDYPIEVKKRVTEVFANRRRYSLAVILLSVSPANINHFPVSLVQEIV